MTTIHTPSNTYQDATVVGVGTDSLTGSDDVILVNHPRFDGVNLEFYAEQDENGNHLNVGNAAVYMTEDIE